MSEYVSPRGLTLKMQASIAYKIAHHFPGIT